MKTRTFEKELTSALDAIACGRIYLRAIAGARRDRRPDIVIALLRHAAKWSDRADAYLHAAQLALAKQGGAS